MKELFVKDLERQHVYKILTSVVAPRPIALVSTISKNGEHNLAPFSFFNAFGFSPPIVVFSPTRRGRDGTKKDTLRNLEEVPECVVHVVPRSIVEKVNLTSKEWPRGVNELEKVGLTALTSHLVKPVRVKESPVHMECKVQQIVPLGHQAGSGNLVICEVILFHIDEAIYKKGMHPSNIDLVARNGLSYYTHASGEAIFELEKPSQHVS